MSRWFKKRSEKSGSPPGILVPIGTEESKTSKITILSYDEKDFHETKVTDLTSIPNLTESKATTWISVEGLGQIKILEQIGEFFDLHPLILEDIVSLDKRPKIESLEKYILIILKLVNYRQDKQEIMLEQVSLILGKNYVITVQEHPSDVLDSIRTRIHTAKGQIRSKRSGYLAFALMDAIIDNYFITLEDFDGEIDKLEAQLVSDPSQEILEHIYKVKSNLILLQKTIWPLREVISRLVRSESPLLQEVKGIYLHDTYEHAIQIIDTIETFREMISGILDTYLTSVSNRMNEVMKVLTIIATIFLPLTLISGIFGMNFALPPELKQYWGFPLASLIMIIIAITMLIYFKKKGWL